METKPVLNPNPNCFLCQTPISQSELILQPSGDQSIFNFLCDLLFNISTSPENGIDRFGFLKNSIPQNSDFCILCNTEIRNVFSTLEIIKSLQEQVNNFKVKVEQALKSLYNNNNSSPSATQDEQENSVNVAGKILAQCLSQPKVILQPLAQEQLDLYRSKRTEIDETTRKIKRVKKCTKKNSSEIIEIFKVDPNPSDLIQEDAEQFSTHPTSNGSADSQPSGSDSESDAAFDDDPAESDLASDDPPKPKKSKKNPKLPLDYETPCIKCDQVFKSKRKRDEHLLQAHDHDVRNFCRFCNVDFRSCLVTKTSKLEVQEGQPRDDPSGQTYICVLDNCQRRSFQSITDLWNHHRKRCIANPTIAAQLATEHACGFCDMKFKLPISLRYHVANVHEKNYKFACEHCGKGFQIQYALQAHIDTVHVAVGKFQCEICSERFKQSKQLKEHLVKHTGEKPFVCEECGKGFHRRELMKKHIENMHPKSQVPCGLCGKLFKSRHYVRNHMNNAHGRGYSLSNIDGPAVGNNSDPNVNTNDKNGTNNNVPEVADATAALLDMQNL